VKDKPRVAVLMGSQSDWPVVKYAVETLKDFHVAFEAHILSAHRTPREAMDFAESASSKGFKVIIASAGMAAHLAGVIASHTVLPVIGVPMKGGAQDGLDALLATVQMPSGVPVATTTLGRAGAVNAALLAVQILALSDPTLKRRITNHKKNMRRKVIAADAKLQQEL